MPRNIKGTLMASVVTVYAQDTLFLLPKAARYPPSCVHPAAAVGHQSPGLPKGAILPVILRSRPTRPRVMSVAPGETGAQQTASAGETATRRPTWVRCRTMQTCQEVKGSLSTGLSSGNGNTYSSIRYVEDLCNFQIN